MKGFNIEPITPEAPKLLSAEELQHMKDYMTGEPFMHYSDVDKLFDHISALKSSQREAVRRGAEMAREGRNFTGAYNEVTGFNPKYDRISDIVSAWEAENETK